MDIFVNFILPPLLGALIGFVTNKIAISMIFKPYKEIRIFGKIRVPFTPGLIPKERYELASNIGEMVENELLTPEVISSKLNSPELKVAVTDFMKQSSEPTLEKAYKPVADTIFSTLKEEEIFNSICTKVEEEISTYISNMGGMAAMMISASGFDRKISSLVPVKLAEILEKAEASAHEDLNKQKILNIFSEKKEALPFDKVADSITEKITEEITEVMRILNIKQLVEDRINSLEIREVEKILLVIVKKHLKWINIFGAMLGSVIGVVQIILHLVQPK